MIISIVNKSSILTDAQVAAIVPALRIQASDFCGAWKISTPTVRFGEIPTALPIYILDDSDQAQALGYHDVSTDWKPFARVFAKTDQKYGLKWTVTLSHELLELIADPWCNSAVQISNSAFVALEVCDPVESDDQAQIINGVPLSNWVYPEWFDGTNKTGPFDRMGRLQKPLALTHGGYVSVWNTGKGWSQVQAQTTPGVTSRGVSAHRMQARTGGDFEIELP
jgi:hypothetical protein